MGFRAVSAENASCDETWLGHEFFFPGGLLFLWIGKFKTWIQLLDAGQGSVGLQWIIAKLMAPVYPGESEHVGRIEVQCVEETS